MIEDIKQSKTMQLVAKDTNKKIELSDKEKNTLLEKMTATNAKIYSEPAHFMKKYPDYRFIITANDGSIQTLFVVNDSYLVLSSAKKHRIYSVNNTVWNFAVSLIPSSMSEDKSKIDYLFTATDAVIKNSEYNGNYGNVYAVLVRVLMENSKIGNTDDKQKVLSIIFTVNGENMPVEIYKGGFKYNGKLYQSTGVAERMIANIAAG